MLRIGWLASVVVLVITLAACGGAGSDAGASDAGGDVAAGAPDGDADAATPDAPGDTARSDAPGDTAPRDTAPRDTAPADAPADTTPADVPPDAAVGDTRPDTRVDAALPDVAGDAGDAGATDDVGDTVAGACLTVADCGPCELCVAGRCVAPAEPACERDADCPDELVCAVHATDPCRSRCTPPPECAADADCGPCQGCVDGDCAVVEPAPCLVDADCGRAHRCVLDEAAPCRSACVFVPECAADGDCGVCETCVAELCEPTGAAPCLGDADCAAGEACVVDPAGACRNACAPAPECASDADCGVCETCVAGVCSETAAAPCLADGDCGEAERCAIDPAGACRNRCEPDPGHPLTIFGAKYWHVYRPHFFASHYADGRVCDRIEGGQRMWGDNTLWMGYALTTFVHEYRAWPNPGTLAVLHRILAAYEELEVLDGDPYDGYVVRSDRGPDYETNWYSRNNEPSGDQVVSTLRGLWDVVTYPGALVHDGVDLKEMARNRAAWLVYRLKADDWRMRNQLGQLVARGDDQRWASWAFQEGAGRISGLGRGVFASSWTVTVLGVPISVGPSYHEGIARQFVHGCFAFTRACVSGRSIDLGLGVSVDVDCNEFNIGLGGDFATISLSDDPASDRWFSAVVDREDIIAEGNAMWALVARHRFNDDEPRLAETAARCFTAPAEPPRGDNLDPNGWCRSWRWAHDFDTPGLCAEEPYWFQTYSGLDYLLCRAMIAAYEPALAAAYEE